MISCELLGRLGYLLFIIGGGDLEGVRSGERRGLWEPCYFFADAPSLVLRELEKRLRGRSGRRAEVASTPVSKSMHGSTYSPGIKPFKDS